MVASAKTDTRTSYEKWLDGVKKGAGTPAWNKWDCDIQSAVLAYNAHLSKTPGYSMLDWHVIKAILCVESGPHTPVWNTRPMQIGNPGDSGLREFFKEGGKGELILPPQWKGTLTEASVRSNPTHNIQAGIGYLLTTLAKSDIKVEFVEDKNAKNGKRRVERRVITGWKPATAANVKKYNGGGHQEYEKRYDAALELMRSSQGAVCAQ